MSEWTLVGRAAELQVIADFLVLENPPAGITITGDAGVGKSRLAAEAAALAAEQGWTVHRLAGSAAARSLPMSAFPTWKHNFDGNPLRLVRQAIETITTTAEGAPILVVADDVHLFDDLSAFVLLQLAVQSAATIVATLRSREPAPDAVTALWKDNHLQRLDLFPLSRPQSDALLAWALGGPVSTECAERMWQLSRGNPLFLRHLVEHELTSQRLILREGRWHWPRAGAIPPSLVDVIDLHIGAAPEPVIDVLDLVAVAEPLELSYLSALADPAAVERAEQDDLIKVTSAAPARLVVMAHPLYGEVRRAKSGSLRLRQLRGRIATTMAAPAAAPDPVRLGLLWLDSDLPPNQDIFSQATWATLLRLDLALTERLGAAAIRAGAGIDIQLLCARMLILLNRGHEAAELLDTIATPELPDMLRSAVLTLQAANLLWILSSPEDSWTVIDNALAVESGPVTQALMAFRAVQLATAARPAEAVAAAEGIARDQLPPLSAMVLIWALTIATGDLGCTQQASELAAEGNTLAAAATELSFETVNLAFFHVAALALAGHSRQAREVAEQTYRRNAEMPHISRSVATAIAGAAALYDGDLPAAVDLLGSAVADFGAHRSADGASYDDSGMSYQFLILHAEALARSGDTAAAEQALTRMQEHRPRSWDYIESDNLLATAWVAAARGDVVAAHGFATQAAKFARAHGQYAREVLAMQTTLQFGGTCPEFAARLHDLAGLVDGPRAPLAARWAAALAGDDGDQLLAVSHHLEAMGDGIAAADAAAHAAAAFRARELPGLELTAAGRAHRLVTACGARTPATSSVTTRLPLSARERQIADLVAQGRSNKDVAEHLTVSVRTVEGHIYRVCTRLKIPTRAELARLVMEFGTT